MHHLLYKCIISFPNSNPFSLPYVFPTSTTTAPHRSPLLSPAKKMPDFQIRVLFSLLNRIFMAFLTCAFASGGAAVGIITGAIKGQTTETGLVRGAGVGAVTGAITALQLMDMMANGEPFSKVALVCSLLNGKVFVEWVSPAVLKAYQWQTSDVETSFIEMFDMFENNGTRGLSENSVNKLPRRRFENLSMESEGDEETNCAICLQDFKNGEEGRELPNCGHIFHLKCIDEWLVRHGSCPICRRDV